MSRLDPVSREGAREGGGQGGGSGGGGGGGLGVCVLNNEDVCNQR